MGRNQHKPNRLAPLEDISEHIHRYWGQRKDDKAIVCLLMKHHIDTSKYGLGFREIREGLGLFRTRKQGHDVESIRPALIRLRSQYPKVGAREIISLLFHEENMSVSRERRKNRLRRKRFWAAGVNDLWAVDQHDKWKPKFGLALHSGIDPFIGRIHWMQIWWTNSNPRLILSYYLDTVEESGCANSISMLYSTNESLDMPLVSQSDPGTENFGLANGHTLLRHLHDPSLEGTLQHRWMLQKKNVMPEIGWSQLRRRFSPGFEDILDVGVNNGWLVFRWVFIPWLQKELDAYRERVNNTAKRADRNKVLPHGAIDKVRALYAPKEHEVFQLVPPDFQAIITQMYTEMGQPPVTRNNCWDVYLHLLGRFRALDDTHNIPADIDEHWGYALTAAWDDCAKEIELTPNLRPLRNGDSVIGPGGLYYMGGVNNGDGLNAEQSEQLDQMLNEDEPAREEEDEEEDGNEFEIFAWFSDEEFDRGSDVDEW
ncbi:hypothetical protein C8R43DRAFT_942992 [Mycena crocata]|nr:hypothetical protein C8R43DRAFT_942992 [Mycena crocata]